LTVFAYNTWSFFHFVYIYLYIYILNRHQYLYFLHCHHCFLFLKHLSTSIKNIMSYTNIYRQTHPFLKANWECPRPRLHQSKKQFTSVHWSLWKRGHGSCNIHRLYSKLPYCT
jgi:hypothetical protein